MIRFCYAIIIWIDILSLTETLQKIKIYCKIYVIKMEKKSENPLYFLRESVPLIDVVKEGSKLLSQVEYYAKESSQQELLSQYHAIKPILQEAYNHLSNLLGLTKDLKINMVPAIEPFLKLSLSSINQNFLSHRIAKMNEFLTDLLFALSLLDSKKSDREGQLQLALSTGRLTLAIEQLYNAAIAETKNVLNLDPSDKFA
jgi:hypothetical protein